MTHTAKYTGPFDEPKNKHELRDLQTRGLIWTVNHAFAGSSFYRKRFQEAGIIPDHIRSTDDIDKLPFTTADDLRKDYPFPLLSVPYDSIVRIHSSSGTTGKRKILSYTAQDIEDWTAFFSRCYRMAGVGPGDRVQIAVGYGLWTAGAGFQAACERAGAMAIPVGPGNLEMQCQFLVDLRPNVLCCTSSMALLLGEEINRRGIRDRVNIKTIIQGSERCSESMRKTILALFGAEHIHDIVGMTELYGPGTGIDCPYHTGIHYWADYFILEIIDPDTLNPVREGGIGEMVVTTLRKEGAPLIRYRTRDLTRTISEKCPCGSVFPMHDRIMGRSDDMIIFRGVNIYPGQIDEILSEVEEISSEYSIELERRDGKDFMLIKVERNPARTGNDRETEDTIRQQIKQNIMVATDVKVVDYGSLPRSERKSKRIFDRRWLP
ncbi:MAG TPA: phenylacetate--CoA ligase family protein [Thermodesulfobacteriaceae bacterium]|nr:phenylacetate--CoA ligase family protein [Thermodesulfobacteriaceae bacterium]